MQDRRRTRSDSPPCEPRIPRLQAQSGRVAQWESARLTRERPLVRTQPRPSVLERARRRIRLCFVSAAKGLLGRSSARPLAGLGKQGGPGAAAGGPDRGGLCEPTRSTFRGDNPHKVERVAEAVEIRLPAHGTAEVILTQPRNAGSGGRPAETSPPPGHSPTRCDRGSGVTPDHRLSGAKLRVPRLRKGDTCV